ncbi:Phospholipase A1 2 [Gryllus bimaculatus]|nr:Phospholipase A1 2 [Gryllus bimaculatus]
MITVSTCAHVDAQTEQELVKSVILRYYFGEHPRSNIEVSLQDAVRLLNHVRWQHDREIALYYFGYNSGPDSSSTRAMVAAYVKHANFIVVDWSQVTNQHYAVAVALVEAVARAVAAAVDAMVNQGADVSHVIGHSLGAHVAGATARSVHRRVQNVIALDPAGPLFYSEALPGEQCTAAVGLNDARCVLALHTCMGVLGAPVATGHVDFFPGGGHAPQPGCRMWNTSLPSFACSHERAVQLWAEAVVRPTALVGRRCGSWGDFVAGRCNANPTALLGKCSNLTGDFFLATNLDIVALSLPTRPSGRSQGHHWSRGQKSGGTRENGGKNTTTFLPLRRAQNPCLENAELAGKVSRGQSQGGVGSGNSKMSTYDNKGLPLRVQESMKKLLTLMERTGYEIVQINGQRLFGPPKHWKGSPPAKGSEVFVGKLPRECYEDELVPVFQTAGKIYQMRLMMDFSGTNRGYAFIQYSKPSEAKAAVSRLNGYPIRPNWKIFVSHSLDNCRLFMGGIPRHIDPLEIEEVFFGTFERLVDIKLYVNTRDPSRNRGFAFLEFENHRSAAMARRKCYPCKLHLWGQPLSVDWALPEPEVEEGVLTKVKKLYIRNLSSSTSEGDIKTAFECDFPPGTVEKGFSTMQYSSVIMQQATLQPVSRTFAVVGGADLGHPPYSPDHSPCDFDLIPKMKTLLHGNRLLAQKKLGDSIIEVSWAKPKDKLIPRPHLKKYERSIGHDLLKADSIQENMSAFSRNCTVMFQPTYQSSNIHQGTINLEGINSSTLPQYPAFENPGMYSNTAQGLYYGPAASQQMPSVGGQMGMCTPFYQGQSLYVPYEPAGVSEAQISEDFAHNGYPTDETGCGASVYCKLPDGSGNTSSYDVIR